MNLIEVYDDDGRKQIVDDPIDLTMIKRLEHNPEDNYDYQYANGTVTRYFYREPLKTYEALVAIQPNPDPIYANKDYRIVSTGTYGAGSGFEGIYGTTLERNPVIFYYYTWLPQTNTNNQNFGLEVFNEEGELSWSSYNTSMNILDSVRENDFRYAGGDLYNYFTKDYGHKDVAVIPISMPRYQENNIVYDVGFSFNEAGVLRFYKRIWLRLNQDEIDQGLNFTIGYRLEFLVVDIKNSQFLN